MLERFGGITASAAADRRAAPIKPLLNPPDAGLLGMFGSTQGRQYLVHDLHGFPELPPCLCQYNHIIHATQGEHPQFLERLIQLGQDTRSQQGTQRTIQGNPLPRVPQEPATFRTARWTASRSIRIWWSMEASYDCTAVLRAKRCWGRALYRCPRGAHQPPTLRRCTPRVALAKCRGHAYALPGIRVYRGIGENL
jgi:hypothetical protein